MTSFVIFGIATGLSSGITPGPLFTLVISESLAHRTRAGILVAVAPLLTDGPIILAALLISKRLADFRAGLAVLALLGAAVLSVMAVENLRTRPVEIPGAKHRSRALLKGVLANALNPAPYLFWITVGAPTLLRAGRHGVAAAAGFLAGFYLCLVGSKIAVATLAGRSRSMLSGPLFLWINRLLGLALLFFAVWLAREGILYLTGLRKP